LNISDCATQSELENPEAKQSDHSPADEDRVFLRSWLTDVSQINPAWDESSTNFDEFRNFSRI